MPPDDEFEGALKIVRAHFHQIMRDLAEDVIENKDEFEKGRFGRADAILEKHYQRLHPLCSVFANLRVMTWIKNRKVINPSRKTNSVVSAAAA